MTRRTLVYMLKRRFYGRWIQHAIYHRATCWHIVGPMARGEMQEMNAVFAAKVFHPCQDCRP